MRVARYIALTHINDSNKIPEHHSTDITVQEEHREKMSKEKFDYERKPVRRAKLPIHEWSSNEKPSLSVNARTPYLSNTLLVTRTLLNCGMCPMMVKNWQSRDVSENQIKPL
jgi:hypothetical protein